jgi:hypothetical protein
MALMEVIVVKNMWQSLELWHDFAVNIWWAMHWLPFLP